MSRSKKLGSIYANNRKRRVASDDEHSEDEFIAENTPHNNTEDMKRNHNQTHHEHAGNGGGHKKAVVPVERCQAKLRSLHQHLSILLREVASVEKEIARWEQESAAAVKAAKLRARETDRASSRNGYMHGYAMAGAASQKRQRVLHHPQHLLEEQEEDESKLWGPAGTAWGGKVMQDIFPFAVKSTASASKRAAPWEHLPIAIDEDTDRDDHDDQHSVIDLDIAMEHDTDEDSGASAWGKLIDKVPSPRQEFEVVIERPASPSTHPIPPQKQASDLPLFFGSSSDFTSPSSSPRPTLPSNPIDLLPPTFIQEKPKQTPSLCFSPLALSAGPPLSNMPSNNTGKGTPLRLAARLRPVEESNFEDAPGSVSPPPKLITPKRPPTTAVSSSENPHSAGKTFVPSPGFFGTYEERRRNRGLEKLPVARVEWDGFEGGMMRSRGGDEW